MRYVKSFVGCFLVLLMVVIPASAAVPDRASIESASLTEYGLLMSSFEQQKKDGKFSGEYPDWYAGAYIDNSGELVVLVTDLTASREKEIIALTKNSSIDVRTAELSMNALKALQMEIIDRIKEITVSDIKSHEMLILVQSFVGFDIDEINNCVFVDIDTTDEVIIKTFKEYISDSNRVVFEREPEIDIETNNWVVGTQNRNTNSISIYLGQSTSFGSYPGSVGYRGYKMVDGVRRNGFVTAGHCVIGGGIFMDPFRGNHGTLCPLGEVIC